LLQQGSGFGLMTIIAGDRGFVPEQKLFPTDNGNEFFESRAFSRRLAALDEWK
jgi:hypothetical protein